MKLSTAYLPHAIFAPGDRGDLPVPRVFIAPQRYVQGQGVLGGIGRYVSLTNAKRVALLMSERGSRNEGVLLRDSLRAAGIESVVRIFRGECSLEEITRARRGARERAGRLPDRRGRRQVHRRGQGHCLSAGHAGRHRADPGVERRAVLRSVGHLLAGRRLDGGGVLSPEPRVRRGRHRPHRGGAGALPGRGHGRRHGHLVRGARLPAEPGGGHGGGRAADARVVRHRRGLRADALREGRRCRRCGCREDRERVARGGRRGQHVAERARLRERRSRRRARRGPELHGASRR